VRRGETLLWAFGSGSFIPRLALSQPVPQQALHALAGGEVQWLCGVWCGWWVSIIRPPSQPLATWVTWVCGDGGDGGGEFIV